METGVRVRAAIAMLIALGGCASLASPEPDPGAPRQTWVAVHTPADWVAPQEMSLEVGAQAWSITVEGGPGVVATDLSAVAAVRLIGVDDCHVYAAFDGAPGGLYAIRFADDGSVSIDQVEAVETGPGLIERDGGPTDCD
jgi:hypothetical protein